MLEHETHPFLEVFVHGAFVTLLCSRAQSMSAWCKENHTISSDDTLLVNKVKALWLSPVKQTSKSTTM